ncbi:MAG TPA: UbiA-like polyprenyltransferase [Spirochaetales bacterium]|nr:UbiA-like polyprenyltransferase [Spirochaetales bacterium]
MASEPGSAASRGAWRRLGDIGDAVIVRHTLFSLPFAVVAILLETDGRPPIGKLILILVAAMAARNAANALNRVVDAEIDARNPRTAGRHLPTGRLTKKELLAFTAVMGAVLVAATAMLNWLCVALLPVAAVLIGGYSYTKRFTWLCHYWLGVACAAAPMGAFLALSGRFELGYFALAGAVALWVAGFDILYALQDIDFDRSAGLHSVPARFGPGGARLIAALSHLGTVVALAALPLFWKLAWPYLAGVAVAAAMLAAEHLIARGGTERHIRVASYSINEILPLVVLAATAVDVYLA